MSSTHLDRERQLFAQRPTSVWMGPVFVGAALMCGCSGNVGSAEAIPLGNQARGSNGEPLGSETAPPSETEGNGAPRGNPTEAAGQSSGGSESPIANAGGGTTAAGAPTQPGTVTPSETGEGLTSGNPIVPNRIRRLSNRELGNAFRSLLGTDTDYEASLPSDVRQRNFTVNQAQTVSSDWHAEVERVAKTAAASLATSGLDQLSPCPGESTDACADAFIASLAEKAFRRSANAAELSDLTNIFRTGSEEGGFLRGMELVLAAVLQSPSFLYITELGRSEPADSNLTPEETATLIAFVTTQGPPDTELMQAARAGQLGDGTARAQHARRLLGSAAGKQTLVNMVVEWFTSDWVLDAAKDNIPEFNQNREGLFRESYDFARAVVDDHNADWRTLLTADFTIASQDVASYYGLSGSGQVSLDGTPRLGMMTQASFLGGHASPTESSPVKRGAAFMRQVLCTDPPAPSTVDLVVAAPPPDPNKSTRQLFAAHSEDALCQGCHAMIDPIGFAFEEFDEGGRIRLSAADNNGHEVDASGSVQIGGEVFSFDGASDLISQVADSELAQECLARTTTRYAFGWSNPATELEFVQVWKQMDPTTNTRIDEVLIALISSELFVQRRAQ